MYIYVNPTAEVQVLRLLVATIATTLFTTALEWLLHPSYIYLSIFMYI